MESPKTAAFIRDIQASKAAQANYRANAARIFDLADRVTDPELAGQLKDLALLCRYAARAEQTNREPR